ncbi:NCAIR mutase (PurE)-related protein [Azospirillum fermentarium]|uniref:nickel pincer cofactor biosynthesis protein LarB n=1 Tax=Azospirillum fermentarium TaxID=1233114 RepID=UPI00222659DA|nr:nickel pincer cofactor biosynthesis protein LarB [Azospirillum fermentarium]MCW2248161.1 NCAIR mutase (PurE)-related protein [Azospirillum fermentarium]
MTPADARAADEIRLDFARGERVGVGEAIFCAGKSAGQLAAILDAAAERQARFLLTRLSVEAHAALPDRHRGGLDYDPVSRTAFFGGAPAAGRGGVVAVVAAGTSDAPAAREAERTLRFNGVAPTMIFDVGVAGLWRLLERVEEIAAHRVVIAAAGMDAALPTVLGGLVPGVLIALPTSTGYGVARNGETALAAVLASCAPGIVAVNIDNGYGAAVAALRAVRPLP